MNSKERVRAALRHQIPDRVPVTMQAGDTAWERLRKHFSVGTNDEVQDILDIDIRLMEVPPYMGEVKPNFVNADGDTVHTHPLGYQYIDKWNGAEYNRVTIEYPLKNVKSMAEFEEKYRWPKLDDFDFEAVSRFYERNQDRFICIGGPGLYQSFLDLYPAEDFYMLMADDPELVKAMLQQHHDFCMSLYERMFEAGKGKIDMIRTCDDYGTQVGLLFGVPMWKEYFAEHTRKFTELAHRYNSFYMHRTSGAILEILPMLVACGVDVIGSLQNAEGMDLEYLKETYGEKICFQGGINAQSLLVSGKPDEVRRMAEQVIRIMNQDGGYILGTSQEFEGDVPINNILAVYRAR